MSLPAYTHLGLLGKFGLNQHPTVSLGVDLYSRHQSKNFEQKYIYQVDLYAALYEKLYI